jgi:hypothetical protein
MADNSPPSCGVGSEGQHDDDNSETWRSPTGMVKFQLMAQRSVYHKDSRKVPFASRISAKTRRKIFEFFLRICTPGPETRVLDVGVTCDDSYQESNFFEHMYPYPHNIVCVGTEDASHLARKYPGLTFQQVKAGDRLPFADQSFEWVFSNAVLEHAGSRESQRRFLAELCRVGRRVFVTTPNRWFPVEHHTGVPFLHYLPSQSYRALLRRTRFRFWADENHLNILTAKSLCELFPPSLTVHVRTVRALGLPANLIAYGEVTSDSERKVKPL